MSERNSSGRKIRLPFPDVYPCVGKCPYGVRCAPGRCYEQERIDAERRHAEATRG